MPSYQTITFGPPYVISAHTAHPTAAMKLVGCILNHFGPLTKQALITPAKKSTLSAGYETWGDSPYFPSNYRSVVVDAVLNHAHDTPLNHMTQYISSWTNLVAPALDQVASGKKTASQAMNAIKAQEDALLARP